MSELKGESKTYIIQYACDDCEKIPNPGCVIVKQNKGLMTYPTIYFYECPNCKKEYEFVGDYPRVVYE